MARVFVTGSADGLGQLAASLLSRQGHEVVLHARNERRAQEARAKIPTARNVVIGDLSTLREMRSVAEQVNNLGAFDAVIHNAAVGYQEPATKTADGLPHVFAINTLAPYVLTSVITKPRRLVYLSSGLHQSADTSLRDVLWKERRWSGMEAYSESKFHDALLAFAVARLWPEVLSNALEPGWVATRMGGPSAPDDLQKGCETQAWLAASDDAEAMVTGAYFFHQKQRPPHPATRDVAKQNLLLQLCQEVSGVQLSR